MAKSGLALAWLLSMAAPAWAAEPALPDPTRPLGQQAAGAAAPGYQLQSIFYGRGEPKAIVNGQLVRVRDRVQGATVLAIDEASVTLRTAAGPRRLSLHRAVKHASGTEN